MYYVRKTKSLKNDETYGHMHYADDDKTTLCGRELGPLWWIEGIEGYYSKLNYDSVTCTKCKKVLNNRNKLTKFL